MQVRIVSRIAKSWDEIKELTRVVFEWVQGEEGKVEVGGRKA